MIKTHHSKQKKSKTSESAKKDSSQINDAANEQITDINWDTLSPDNMMQLQRAIGNQALQRILNKKNNSSNNPILSSISPTNTISSHNPTAQREWVEDDGVQMWDELIDGVTWFAKGPEVMWYRITDASQMPEGQEEEYKTYEGQEKSYQEWRTLGLTSSLEGSDKTEATAGLLDSAASGSGITGDMSDLGKGTGGALNNPAADIGEGANVGIGALGLIDVRQKWKEGEKVEATATGLTAVGQMAHGTAKATKGFASAEAGKANAHWTQVGDIGASIGDGLGTISSLIMTIKTIDDAWNKSDEEGGLTTREKIDLGAETLQNVGGYLKSGMNTARDIQKVVDAGATSAISSMAQVSAILGIIVGSIQLIHGSIKVGFSLYNDGQIQKVKQPIRKAMLQVFNEDMPLIQSRIEFINSLLVPGMDPSVKNYILGILKQAEAKLLELQTAFTQLKSFYDQVSPAMDAMRKIENQRMESGALKMAQGTAAVVSSALLLSGYGAPVAIAIAAIGGILTLGNIALKWRRNVAGNRAVSIASKLDPAGNPGQEAEEGSLSYQEMEKRLYKCYYNHLPEIMEKKTEIQGLDKSEFTDVKHFGWEDKKARLKSKNRKSVASLGDVASLDEMNKREYWIQVKPRGAKEAIYKEKPKGTSWVAMKLSASAHKSKASMNASVEVVADALYSLGIGSYDPSTKSFVSCPVKPIGTNEDIDMEQITAQTSTTLLKVAGINSKRWGAWLKSTKGDPKAMKEKIKKQVSP